MDSDIERLRADAEAKRQQSETARQDSERARVTAEQGRTRAEQRRRAAATEVADTVATLSELLSRMEAVEQMRRGLRGDEDE